MRLVGFLMLALWQIWSTSATMCVCVEGPTWTTVYSKQDVNSEVIGYLKNGECFHGEVIEGNDWVTVKDITTELHFRRDFLSPCHAKSVPKLDIPGRLKRTSEKEEFTNKGQVSQSVGHKRFLLETSSLNRAQCNFDLDSLCSWTNVHGHDDFDWVLYQSSTPTDDTGPDFDHTLRNATGRYVFIESSAPRNLFDSAWIQSPTIEAKGQLVHCFQFWYHMYGTSIGRLDVYQATDKSVPGNLMWSLAGDHGNTWLQGQVALESYHNYSIIIVGFVGNGYLGDIAVDDVSISDGFCDVKPPTASRSDVSNSTVASVDGSWYEWLPWTACDVTCGGGTQIRKRACYFPPRVTHGNGCIGNAIEHRKCNNENCTVVHECFIVENVFCSDLAYFSCTDKFNILCGSDGQYYPNQCEMSKAKCHDNTLTISADTTKCQANVGGRK